jgi:ABC-2 type transport system ATP-binding protein
MSQSLLTHGLANYGFATPDVPAIEIERLHKRYGEKVAVDDVSFRVEEGEVFGVLGPNGAGKTTTVECVEGLRQPDGGTVRVLGLDPRRDRQELRQVVGAQLQQSQLPDKLTVAEAVDLYRSFYRSPADTGALLDRLGLAEKRQARWKKLSGGQKQRLSIALALVGQPRVAVLDELTTGLDPAARRDAWSIVDELRDKGATVLLVTHFMEEAERLCDRVAIIDAGRVAAVGRPEHLIESTGAGQRVRFSPSAPFPDRLVLDLPTVASVTRHNGVVTVTGNGDVATSIVVTLAAHGVVPEDLRVERPSLEDAFVAITGHAHHTAGTDGDRQ